MAASIKRISHALGFISGAILFVTMLSGCSASKDVLYMQNMTPEQVMTQVASEPVKVEPGDEIMVYVSCKDPELAARLSLMAGSRAPQVGAAGASVSYQQTMLPYTVSSSGDISMPEIGSIHVAGLTRKQIADKVAKAIVDARLANENTVNVTVQFANLTFTAIGEVTKRGVYNITKDQLTLLEALAMVDDLTIYGRRDAVWVLREEPDGSRKSYKLDLRGTDFMSSPAYMVQQNDVIYVEPNSIRAGQSTLNENTFKSVGFWTSLASLAMSIATFAITLSR